jgi:outer membrane murein-binding lipoprotein Lpp
MTTKQELEDRRNQVKELKTLGYTLEKIADQLQVTYRTVASDVKALKTRAMQEEQQIDQWEVIAELSDKQKRRMRMLWKIAMDPGATRSEKLKALAHLHNEDELYIKRAQIAGILPKDSPMIAIQNNMQVEGTYTLADAFQETYGEKIAKKPKTKGTMQSND